jgi:hypothetical protein
MVVWLAGSAFVASHPPLPILRATLCRFVSTKLEEPLPLPVPAATASDDDGAGGGRGRSSSPTRPITPVVCGPVPSEERLVLRGNKNLTTGVEPGWPAPPHPPPSPLPPPPPHRPLPAPSPHTLCGPRTAFPSLALAAPSSVPPTGRYEKHRRASPQPLVSPSFSPRIMHVLAATLCPSPLLASLVPHPRPPRAPLRTLSPPPPLRGARFTRPCLQPSCARHRCCTATT